ncbi:hypothetical protein [Streptomyces sp. NPDC050485]|uniref:hypothetical protein n=1 Tax=Streptomyces sp. NPDC050485 TaxID=3365617 RepID=UPI0037A0DAF4
MLVEEVRQDPRNRVTRTLSAANPTPDTGAVDGDAMVSVIPASGTATTSVSSRLLISNGMRAGSL